MASNSLSFTFRILLIVSLFFYYKEDNIFDSIKNIKNINKHPYEFYQKNGYYIVGIIPNANGKNKPDIWMWKSLIKE